MFLPQVATVSEPGSSGAESRSPAAAPGGETAMRAPNVESAVRRMDGTAAPALQSSTGAHLTRRAEYQSVPPQAAPPLRAASLVSGHMTPTGDRASSVPSKGPVAQVIALRNQAAGRPNTAVPRTNQP